MRLVLIHSVLAAALVLWAFPSVSPAQNADARLESFFKKYLEESMRQRPLQATRLGDHRFDAQLDDISPKARAAWAEHARKTLAELPREVDRQALSRDGRVDYDILRHELEESLWLEANTHPFEEDPRAYGRYLSDAVYVLLTQSTLPQSENIANAISRMRQIPAIIAAAKAGLKSPPRVVAETAVQQNKGTIAFYDQGILELVGQAPQRDPLKAAAAEAVKDLKQYQQFLEQDLLPRADGSWRLGKEKFARKLELELNAGLTAQEVLAEAETEFARVEREMYVIARQLWSRYYPQKIIPPDDADGRHATIAAVLAAVGQEHGKPEDLARDARGAVTAIQKFIRERSILDLPEPDRCQVIEMPEFHRGNAVAYLRSAPPLDAKTASFFAVSPPPKDWDAQRVRSFLEEYNRHMLQILTIHEAYPGHYVQLEYANRNPSPIRRVLGSGVYVEGWAVYTEQMMLDQGYGNGDLPLRLTQLKFYLRAITNAILDHKMHCTQMSDDEAMRLLVDRAYQSEGEARLKVIRAKLSSCQLSTYFVGRMAMVRLRQTIQRELGDRFDLRSYHQAVLECGPVPVTSLPELIRERLRK